MKTPQSHPQADHTHSAAPFTSQSRQAQQASPDATAIAHSPRMTAQRQAIRAAFGPNAAATQLQGDAEQQLLDEVPAPAATTQRVAAGENAPNLAGMPGQLKSGIEALSGMDMSDVRVHRNSDKPAQLSALADAQGDDIHLGPGQERHLGHEAWHVVQQKQGRVKATQPKFHPRTTAIQLRADDGMREIKQYYDKIQRRIPGAWQNCLQVLDDVTARAGDAQTWRNNKTQAEDLWQTWQVAYNRAEADQGYAYPGRLTVAIGQMQGYFQAFDAVHALLFENGIAGVKQQLAEQHYLAAPVDTFNLPFYSAAPEESLNQLKARIRAQVMAYVRPGEDAWLGAAGYNADPCVRQLAQIAGYNCHWTMYRANLGDLVNLRIEDGAGHVNAGEIDDRLIPTGAGTQGPHVSLEVAGVGENKPRIFGRPANLARTYNNGNRPIAVTWAAMTTALDNANADKSTQIQTWAGGRNARIRANWEAH